MDPRLIYPGGDPVDYAFDAAGRLTGLEDWDARSLRYTYFADGAVETVTNPNGTVTCPASGFLDTFGLI